MKGVAGNLGAGAVQAAAAALEKAIAAGAGPERVWRRSWAPSTGTLDDFVVRSRGGPARGGGACRDAGRRDRDRARGAKAVVEEMLAHLRNFDAAAGDLLEAREEVFRFLLGAEQQAAFAGHVGGYAFDEALALLEQAAKDKGVLSA